MFDRRMKYKAQHGNCLIPTTYKDDPKLGNWVQTQRADRDKMSEERKARLDTIEFSVERSTERSRLAEKYDRQNMGCNV